jgi:hypothetical protein
MDPIASKSGVHAPILSGNDDAKGEGQWRAVAYGSNREQGATAIHVRAPLNSIMELDASTCRPMVF